MWSILFPDLGFSKEKKAEIFYSWIILGLSSDAASKFYVKLSFIIIVDNAIIISSINIIIFSLFYFFK